MKGKRIILCCAAALIAANVSSAKVWLVRERFDQIQLAINDDSVATGDTISVWGLSTETPPFYFYETLNFRGKGLTIINRSFIPGQVPYEANWEHVVIDGQQVGSVVRIVQATDAVLRGFTITNGRADSGAGVFCLNSPVQVLNNHVTHNWSGRIRGRGIGGGVCIDGSSFEEVVVANNLIDSNYAQGWKGSGGGLYCTGCNPLILDNQIIANSAGVVDSAGASGGGAYVEAGYGLTNVEIVENQIEYNRALGPQSHGGGLRMAVENNVQRLVIQNNQLRFNQSDFRGAGLHLFHYGQLSLDPEDSSHLVADNDISNNEVAQSQAEGGIYAYDWSWPMRRNVITGNSGWGVGFDASSNGTACLGTTEHPGFNAFQSDSGLDLHLESEVDLCYAIGNYWGTISTNQVRSRTAGGPVYLDPVAASGKWFDVEANSVCSTGVIVTGDLTVCEGASLVVDSGRTFEFLTNPDHSSAAGDEELCDLIIEGGAELQVSGGAGDTTRRTLFKSRHGEPGSAGDWYGIRLLSEAQATLTHCDIRHAYIGVDAQSDAQLDIVNSAIHDNQLCGIAWDGAYVTVVDNSIYGNDVYGICAANLRSETQIDGNILLDNPIYGISCDLVDEDVEVSISDNQIDEGVFAPAISMYGIAARTTSQSLSVAGNQVTGYVQAGICAYDCQSSIYANELDANGYYGLVCLNGAAPMVRENVIDNQNVGVLIDESSVPDLGTTEDPGNNSILMGNGDWTENENDVNAVYAQYNWWGTEDPGEYKEWFLGTEVVYDPWLTSPPGDGDGGGQSVGREDVIRPALEACWPNPSQGRMEFRYQLARSGPVRVEVYSPDGQRLRTLEDSRFNPGRYRATWDGRDQRGRPVPAGVYLYQLETPGFRAVRKAVITR